MKIQTIDKVPYSDKFDKNIAYIYWADIWWDGAGADASILWEDANGLCHYLAIGTGETDVPVEPKVYKNFTIKNKIFWGLSQNLIAAGVTDIKSPSFRTPSVPADSYFFMKLKTGEIAAYIVKGKITNDEKINRVDEIMGNFIRSLITKRS